MAAIATFIPFILFMVVYEKLYTLHYGADSGDFTIFRKSREGYEPAILYAEAETKLFSANESDDTVTYMYLEEVKIFLQGANNVEYFKLDTVSGEIHLTTDKSEASFFTLKTTPDLHKRGEFQIAFSSSSAAENATIESESSLHDPIVMENDRNNLSKDGPYRLVSNKKSPFGIRGVSTTLPN